MRFNKRLKELRKEYNLTQKDLAASIGVKRSTLAGYETKGKQPDYDTLDRIAKTLKVSIDYLLGRTEIKELLPNITSSTIDDMLKIPVIGEIQCGEPILAVKNVDQYKLVDKDSLSNNYNYFFLRAKGDSMKNSGIKEGSFILIRKQENVSNGDIAAVLINTAYEPEVTLKKVYKTNEQLILQPDNPDYEPMIFNDGDIRILGKAIKVEFYL